MYRIMRRNCFCFIVHKAERVVSLIYLPVKLVVCMSNKIQIWKDQLRKSRQGREPVLNI